MSNFSINNKSEEFLVVNVNDPVKVDADDISGDESKSGKIAYEIFGMIPVFGTFIGIHHMYKAITGEEQVNGWEIAKIITQIFSFAVLPQIIFLTACAIKDCMSRSQANYEFVNSNDVCPSVKVDTDNQGYENL